MKKVLSQEYVDKRIAEIKKEIKYYSSIGLSTDSDLENMEHNLDEILHLKEKGYISGPEVDELFAKGLDLVERRYSYLEERESLGNYWW